mmetsp:Transcript_28160/g.39753  ORF Transcript_28160/g.39753 Transcript_28160/m.39753 type:complete len:600 (-) Transcript_28160:693-2492(-)
MASPPNDNKLKRKNSIISSSIEQLPIVKINDNTSPMDESANQTSKWDNNNIENVLENMELIPTLYPTDNDKIDPNELTHFIFKFFEANGKAKDLIRWAIQKEVDTTKNAGELCRGDTIATKIFNIQFFGDVGRKYIASLVNPILKSILSTSKSLEIEADKAGKGVDVEANLVFFCSQIEQFIDLMVSAVDLCPLELRDSFSALHSCVQSKFGEENALQIITSVFFLRFLCPTLVFPVQYGLLSEDNFSNNTHSSRGLVLLSKLMQHLANAGEIVGAHSYAKKYNEFITENHPKLLHFTKLLVSEDGIHRVRLARGGFRDSGYYTLSMELIPDQFKKFASQNLIHYLKFGTTPIQKMNKNPLEILMDAYSNREEEIWKLAQSNKKKSIYVYERKFEDSPVVLVKAVTRLNVDMRTMYDVLLNQRTLMRFNSNWVKCELVEKYDDTHHDWYVETSASFPYTARDWLYTIHSQFNTDRSILWSYSIFRDDRPPNKKYVRGHIISSGYILDQDRENPAGVLMTTIQYMDHRGKQGSTTASTLFALQKSIHKYFEEAASNNNSPNLFRRKNSLKNIHKFRNSGGSAHGTPTTSSRERSDSMSET